jgi:hypothetical protein
MKFVRRCRCLAAWIAIFAILLAALAPGIAQALAPAQQPSTPWAEICTSAGMQIRQGLAPTGDSGDHKGMMSTHCPFCLNHAAHFALPATPPDLALAIGAGAAVPCSSVTASSSRFACTSPQSRAPPALS